MEKDVASALSTSYPVQHTNSSSPKWHEKLSESVVAIPSIDTATDEILGAFLVDGAEFGQFCKIGDPKALTVTLHAGSLQSGDILMEIQGCRIPGMTQRDALSWLRSQGKHGHPVMIKMVRSSLLPASLGEFLQRKYAKESPDATLQQAIRENVYSRTAACTTRPRKPTEQHGIDYWFVSTAYFGELRSANALLECGQFEGNWFGTPVPPMEDDPASSRPVDADGIALPLSEEHLRLLRSLLKRPAKQNAQHLEDRSSNNSTQPGNGSSESSARSRFLRELERDPLPSNWEVMFDEQDRPFFVDRAGGATQWLDPRLARTMKSDPLDCNDDELPYGWQRIEDPQHGTYFVDHLNRRTQYENPVLEAKRRYREAITASAEKASASPSRSEFNSRPNTTSGAIRVYPNSAAAPPLMPPPASRESQAQGQYAARSQALMAAPRRSSLFAPEIDVRAFGLNPVASDAVSLTPDRGNLVRATIVKGLAGFGFKLASKADGLQRVKEITDARRCGELRVNDVVVAVDGRDVRRVAHAELVAVLQSYPLNATVTFVLERQHQTEIPAQHRAAEQPVDRNGPSAALLSTKQNLLPANGARLMHAKSAYDLRNDRGVSVGPVAVRGEVQPAMYASPVGLDRQPASGSRLRGADQFRGSLSHGLDAVGVSRTNGDWPDSGSGLQHRPEMRMSHSALNRISDFEATRSPPPSGTGSSSATSPDLLNTTPDFIPASVLLKRSPGPGLRQQLSSSQLNLARLGASNLSKSFMNLNASPAADATQQPASAAQLAGARQSLTSTSSAAGSIGVPMHRPAILSASTSINSNQNNVATASQSQLNANAVAFGNQSQFAMNAPSNADVFQVDLSWGEAGFGFKVIGGAELLAPISVGFLEPQLIADGRLRVGDELLAVNEVPTTNSSCTSVVQLLSRIAAQKQPLRLTVRRSNATPRTANKPTYPQAYRPGVPSDNTPNRPPSSTSSLSNTSGYASQNANSPLPPGTINIVLQKRTSSESFGFVLITNIQKRIVTVARVQADSPASRCGLQPGDRILFVNTTDVNTLAHAAVVSMIKQAGATIRLTVLPVATMMNGGGAGLAQALAGQRDSLTTSVDSDVSSPSAVSSTNVSGNVNARYALATSSSYNVIATATSPNDPTGLRQSTTTENIVQPQIAARRFANANPNANAAANSSTFNIQLKRSARGFGFSVKGGYEFSAMPLQIFQIAKGGTADLDGRLQPGDEVLQINEYRTHNMTQKNAIELIQQCGPVIQLVIRRSS